MLAVGSDDFQAESLVGGEIGYRIQPVSLFSVDATVFTHHISNLRSMNFRFPGLPVVVVATRSRRCPRRLSRRQREPATWWRTTSATRG